MYIVQFPGNELYISVAAELIFHINLWNMHRDIIFVIIIFWIRNQQQRTPSDKGKTFFHAHLGKNPSLGSLPEMFCLLHTS